MKRAYGERLVLLRDEDAEGVVVSMGELGDRPGVFKGSVQSGAIMRRGEWLLTQDERIANIQRGCTDVNGLFGKNSRSADGVSEDAVVWEREGAVCMFALPLFWHVWMSCGCGAKAFGAWWAGVC